MSATMWAGQIRAKRRHQNVAGVTSGFADHVRTRPERMKKNDARVAEDEEVVDRRRSEVADEGREHAEGRSPAQPGERVKSHHAHGGKITSPKKLDRFGGCEY